MIRQEGSRIQEKKKKFNTAEFYTWLLLTRTHDKLKHTEIIFKREILIEDCISTLESGHCNPSGIVELKLAAGKINITIPGT